ITNRLDVQRTMGAYIQDQISLTDRLQVRVGGRFDDFLLRVDDRLTRVLGRRKRSRFSPQAGIVYELSKPLSLYATYGEGY
ncbi:TonB-dependent receptor, partial [Bacillus amyloliquefaciens]|nr:TonB-dependent receptor [Bacillus amyloliquefaciens]